ncbi:hypothetical protein IPM19_03620 [bacterium]|nr:MAG: hypothetical protein IPM19_03620 [bacterium]
MKAYISQLISEAIQQISPQESGEVLGSSTLFDVSTPKAGFGDYATNAAMVLYKKFNVAPASNPAEFAAAIAAKAKDLDRAQTFLR